MLRFFWPRVLGCPVGEIDVQDVEDEDLSRGTVALAADLIFAGNVVSERSFSSRAVFSSAARAFFVRAVSDDP